MVLDKEGRKPHGKSVSSMTSANSNDFFFTGGSWDKTTGLFNAKDLSLLKKSV